MHFLLFSLHRRARTAHFHITVLTLWRSLARREMGRGRWLPPLPFRFSNRDMGNRRRRRRRRRQGSFYMNVPTTPRGAREVPILMYFFLCLEIGKWHQGLLLLMLLTNRLPRQTTMTMGWADSLLHFPIYFMFLETMLICPSRLKPTGQFYKNGHTKRRKEIRAASKPRTKDIVVVPLERKRLKPSLKVSHTFMIHTDTQLLLKRIEFDSE